MKLSKAIEILTQRGKDYRPGFDPDEREATKLGIEALKTILTWRTGYTNEPLFHLPGETPENEK